MTDALERARKLARAAEAHALFASRVDLAHNGRVQRARTPGRELVVPGAARLFSYDAEPLRDHVPGALNLHRVADAHAEPLDLVGVVQGRVLHHNATDRDRLELGDRGQETGAPDLDLDV